MNRSYNLEFEPFIYSFATLLGKHMYYFFKCLHLVPIVSDTKQTAVVFNESMQDANADADCSVLHMHIVRGCDSEVDLPSCLACRGHPSRLACQEALSALGLPCPL